MSDRPPVDAEFRVMKPNEQSTGPVININIPAVDQLTEQKKGFWGGLFGKEKHSINPNTSKAEGAMKQAGKIFDQGESAVVRVTSKIKQQEDKIRQLQPARVAPDLKRETEIDAELERLKQVKGKR